MGMVYPKNPTSRQSLLQIGWPAALIHGSATEKSGDIENVCRDDFNPTMYYWKHVQGGNVPNTLCSKLHTQGYCRKPHSISMTAFLNQNNLGSVVLDNLNTDKFAKLFCQKSCGFTHPGCDHAHYEKEKTKKYDIEQAHKKRQQEKHSKTKKNNECVNKQGLTGSGSYPFRTSRRLLGSGYFVPAGGSNSGGCYTNQGTYVGSGQCQGLGGYAVTQVGVWAARRRRTAWDTPGCNSECANIATCYGYNGYFHYRRRAGRSMCQLWGSNSEYCSIYAPLPNRI